MTERNEMPEVVYHYTSMDTLLKIAEQQTIRATSIRYLNDVTERTLLFDELKKRLAIAKNVPLDGYDYLKAAIDMGADKESSSFAFLPFVTSFSEDHDSLPQWRAYCPHGNGVAIGIRTESLITAKPRLSQVDTKPWRRPNVEFSSVTYLHPDRIEMLDQVLATVLEKADDYDDPDMVDDDGDDAFVNRVESLIQALIAEASLVKHASFSTEREFRLVVSNLTYNGFIDYRPSRSTLVPFTEAILSDPNEFSDHPRYLFEETKRPKWAEPYFIERIVVGPTPHDKLSCDALLYRFKDKKKDVEIIPSSVPYRDTI